MTRAAGRGRSSRAVSFTLSTGSYCRLSFRGKYLLFLLRLFDSAWLAKPFWFWVFLQDFLGGRDTVTLVSRNWCWNLILAIVARLFAVSCDFWALWVNKFELEESDDFRVITQE